MLKVNVPERCVDFDEEGNAIAASFDASTLNDDDNGGDDDEESGGAPKSKVVRLIMRQDSTHRVILNTAVHASTLFQERKTLKSTSILLTAIEGTPAKPVNIQMKVSCPQPEVNDRFDTDAETDECRECQELRGNDRDHPA